MRQLWEWMSANQTRFFLVAGILVAFSLLVLDVIYLKESSGIYMLIESHGLLLDIVIFGIILTLYDRLTHRKRMIQRYKETLDDIRGWAESSAMYRNVGNIRRLNRMGISDLNLSRSYLRKAHLNEVNLSNSNLGQARLEHAKLQGANLKGANIYKTAFNRADLSRANLSHVRTNVTEIDKFVDFFQQHVEPTEDNKAFFEQGLITGVNFSGANLQYAKLKQAELISADFVYSNLVLTDMEGADLRGADFSFAILVKDQPDKDNTILKANLKHAKLEHAKAQLSQWDDFLECGADEEEMAKMNWEEVGEKVKR